MNGFSWLKVAEGLGLGVVASILVSVPSTGIAWDIVSMIAVCALIWLLFAGTE
jgi:hypothetical protein